MRSLPRVVSQIPSDLRNFLDRVREYLSEDGENRFVTVRELRAGGVVGTTPNGTVTTPEDYQAVDPTIPEGLTTSSGLASVFVSWTAANYLGHAKTEIWASTSNTFSTKVLVGTSDGNTFSHNIGAGGTRYYWIRFVNINDVKGPYNSQTGTVGVASTDPAYLLDVLAGSITDAELSTALNTQIDTNTTQVTNVRNLYTVKMDNQGYLTGFGLMSNLADGGVPTTDFFVNANRFAVTTPTTSIPVRANSTAYSVGAFVGVASSTSKMLVCKVAGTSSTSAPNIASIAIGTLVVDGGVTWQVSSRVPLSVLTTTATINGVVVPPGVYIDGASIVNATITNASIGDAAITNAKINDLSADKITAGSIQTGYIRSTTYTAGTAGWSINADGSAEFAQVAVRGTLYGGGATGYTTQSSGTTTGLFSGVDSTIYKWRVGNPTGARIQWTGTAIEVYNSSNVLTISSGGIQSISYADITGAKPPIDADKTSLNTAAAIAGQGSFATLSQITSANISTYIASAAIGTAQIANAAITNALIGTAAITSAKIGNLEVDSAKIANLTIGTGKVADNAITQLVSTYTLLTYPSVFTTAGTIYTFPSFAPTISGLLVITITSVFHNFSTTTDVDLQAINYVNNQSGIVDPPIHRLIASAANTPFIPIGPTPATSGSSVAYTSQEVLSVTAGQSITITVEMVPSSANSTVYLIDSYYTAILYKK